MSPQHACPDCGAPMPPDAPRGLCPNCLMGAALSRFSDLDAPGSHAEVTVSLQPSGSARSAAGALAALAESVGGIPRVLLRDSDGPSAAEPLVQPGSPEIPDLAGRSAHFQLFGEIARGGMGAVLKGRDVDLGRDLAVKVLLEKHRENPDLVRRFVEEAQIAGQLQHPGIVPIHELGAFPDQRPYFAMKLVKGRTLAALLAARSSPEDGLPRFLGIFEQIAQTVAYAHARGVIHRDLKPSNVMVGSFGEVQVMDWGLAKVLPRGGVVDDADAGQVPDGETLIATARSGGDPDSDHSRAGSVMGTPSYMAPEQARGEVDRVDERADVFALGSMLCELLTGSPAFTGRNPGEIQRKAARGETADALTRLAACGADPELVGIARDGLAAEPEDRPRDAKAVADRITAHLAGVQERLRSAEIDRARAEARAAEERRRRKLQLGLAASIAASLLLGGVGLAAFAAVLDRQKGELARANTNLTAQRRRAEDREQQAIDAVKRFRDAVAENPELKNNPVLEDLRKTLLKEPLAFFRDLRDRLQADGDTRPESLARLATATYELGYLSDEIGDKRDAITAHREAMTIFKRLTDAHPTSIEYRRDLARSDNSLGILLAATGQPAEARAAFEDARAILERLVEAHPNVAEYQRSLAVTHNNLGNLLRVTGQPVEARTAYDASLAIRRALVNVHPDVAEYHLDLAVSHHNLGVLLSTTGETAEGRASHEAALAILQRLVEAHPDIAEYQMTLGRSYNSLGLLLAETGEPAEGRRAMEAALAILQRLVEAHPTVTEYLSALARSYNSLGLLLRSMDEPAEGRRAMEAALAIWKRLSDAHPQAADYASLLGAALNNLAMIDLDTSEFAAAASRLREAIVWQRKALVANPLHPTYRKYLRNHYTNLRRAAQGLNDPDLSAEAERGLAELRATDPQLPAPDTRLAAVLGGEAPKDNTERLGLAKMAYDTARFAAAARFWGEALEADPKIASDRQAKHPYNAACSAALAAAGQGEDDPKPNDAERAALRNQALGWLKSELAAWSAVLNSDEEAARARVVSTLRHWERDADLAGVRDPDSLERLPEDERAEWRALWAEVDRLLKRADGTP